ncbi:Predicted dienelactone hydrolase [Roseateles sp. YR242]|uniref:alpha/beta hydrolase family protein n=1 Tax=Roseateles sp. YR242 TaxID=1855305 RepID=UPI0008B6434E|nr:alpha/beta fold hydrolase [Roseateles sp. YR242]SEK59537.1 Predicted dienelactone hydrolase [Roseateles sp. YR242]
MLKDLTRSLPVVLLALVVASVLTACAGPAVPSLLEPDQPAVPGIETAEDGSHQWQDLDWRDDQRHRAVPVRVYWPAGPQAEPPAGGWPVIIFSHGLGGSRRGYSYLGHYWASQGFVALHVQHVGSDRRLWAGGFGASNSVALMWRLNQAAQPREAIDRVRDMQFALDKLLTGELATRLNTRQIIVAGHSYGANTSLLLAGARVGAPERFQAGQAEMVLNDPRIRAAILISAPPFYGEGDPGPIVGGITVPTLHISATMDEIRIPGYYSGPSDRVQLFEATGGPRKALAMFKGGSHSIFTDRLNTGGEALNPQVKAATATLSVAWLRLVLNEQDGPLQTWQTQHGALLSRWESPMNTKVAGRGMRPATEAGHPDARLAPHPLQ